MAPIKNNPFSINYSPNGQEIRQMYISVFFTSVIMIILMYYLSVKLLY